MLPLPAAIVEQRLSILAIYANAVLSAHEAALESRNAKSSRLWGQPFTLENILDMLEAAITCPPSEAALAKMPETGVTRDPAVRTPRVKRLFRDQTFLTSFRSRVISARTTGVTTLRDSHARDCRNCDKAHVVIRPRRYSAMTPASARTIGIGMNCAGVRFYSSSARRQAPGLTPTERVKTCVR
jgi:hypothetical protein